MDIKSNVVSYGWTPTEHDFGTVSHINRYVYKFVYTGTTNIKSIESSCPCVQIVADYSTPKEVTLVAVWKPKKPQTAFTTSTKNILVKYLDNTREYLYLKAVIT